MKKRTAAIVLAAGLGLVLAGAAEARPGHGGGGHAGSFHGGGFHGGGARHFGGGSHFHSRIFIGGAFVAPLVAAPYYAAPYYYDPYYYAPPPVQYIEPPAPPAPQASYWYYCPGAGAYYPYVQQCPGGWQQVLPR